MRLIARFCIENEENFEVCTLFDEKKEVLYLDKENPTIKSIARQYPAAVWFERKMHDDFGILIEDAFNNRPLIHHERFPKLHPMRKAFTAKVVTDAPFKPYKYEHIKGNSVFEVAVGPIHAGIIEPGHFQFSQSGEEMLHLEVRHFYTYRGIEKMLEGKTLQEAKPIIERISGNESIAYQIAWFQIVLEAGGSAYHDSLQQYHAMLLEFERLIHHVTDLGFIPNDAGFSPALAYASKLAEETRRMLEVLTSHRFGFGAVDFEAKPYDKEAVLAFVQKLEEALLWFENWIMDIPSLWDRFDTTGILPTEKAQKYGCVGVMSKASGVKVDRRDARLYHDSGFVLCFEKDGDVSARFKVRLQEVHNSLIMIKAFAGAKGEMKEPDVLRDGDYVAYTESSIGELCLFVRLKDGKIERFFARDPSFINWQALHIMMPGNIIADFPLINKSCDLSYAGNDL